MTSSKPALAIALALALSAGAAHAAPRPLPTTDFELAVACAGELSPLAFYLDQVIKDTDTDDAKQLRGALHDAELKWLQRARDLGPSKGLTADQVYQKFLDYIAATTPPRLEGQTDQAHDKANLDSRVENINPCLAALRAVP